MKWSAIVSVAGDEMPLVSDDIRLELRSPGRANFTIKCDTPPSGLVTFDIGYNKSLQRYFIGFVESSSEISKGTYMIFCRELTASLNRPLPIVMRNVTMHDTIQQIAELTALQFNLPDKAYANTATPCFYNIGSGYFALDSLGDVFDIPDYIWQQQGDGKVFAGSWSDSRWAQRETTIPEKYFDKYLSTNNAVIAAIPTLRPGVQINQGKRIKSIQLSNGKMTVTW